MGGAVAYFITIPSGVARKWVRVLRFVVIERDPLDPYALRVRLVKPEEVKWRAGKT